MGEAERRLYEQVRTEMRRALLRAGVTQRELSIRMGLSEARVSRLLGDDAENMTLRSLARMGGALGMEFEIRPKRR
jgi:transcriptional regulator with XRE-family HTH domain